jgi:hypothetical protein
MKLGDIATALGAKVIGDATRDILRVVHPADADAASDLALVLTPDAIVALP